MIDSTDIGASVTAKMREQKRKRLLTEQSGSSTYTLPTAWGDAHGPSAKRPLVSKGLLRITQVIFAFFAVGCGSAQTHDDRIADHTVEWTCDIAVGGASAELLDDEVLLFTGFDIDPSADESAEPAIVVGRVDVDDGLVLWESNIAPRGGAVRLNHVGATVLVRQAGALEALDVRTGSYLWGVSYEEAPVQVDGGAGRVLVVLPDGIVNARDERTGRHLWTIDTGPWTWERIVRSGDAVYAVAGDESNVGVFDATYPSATPLWSTSAEGGVRGTWHASGHLFGRFDGVALRRADLASGALIGEPLGHADGWHGALRLEIVPVDGIVLRMQTIEAFSADAPDDAVWTTTLPSASSFDSIEPVLDESALALVTEHSTFLLDAASGELLWRATTDSTNRFDTDECDSIGTTGSALIRACGRNSVNRIEAVRLLD